MASPTKEDTMKLTSALTLFLIAVFGVGVTALVITALGAVGH
jgi:hypothetical protein